MRAGDFVGVKVYRKPAEDKRTKKDGTPRSPKKLGKIHFPVFTPGGTRVVGFMVRQSDIAGMIERPDRFVALDAIGVYEGAVAVDDVKGTYDAAAAKRLDINLDDCIIWVGMDVRTESGDVVGYCSDVEFKPRSGIVQAFYVTAGAASSVLVGDTQVPPTMLHNAWLFRPFEMFVEMYGLPNYHDLDPTPFVAVTFCLLFGIMFGDLGQGALLLIGGLLLEKIKHNRLAGIVGRAGLTSMIFGFLFGSVFGVETLLNPVHQSLFGVREKLFEVMDASATMPLLIGAVAIGAVLILMTMIINIYLNIKRKEMAEALFSQNGVAGFIFYGYIILFLIGMFMPDMLPFNPGSKPLMILFVGVPVVLFFMKEPLNGLMKGEGLTPHQGWGNFVLEEVFEVLEIILSFVTNSLSYLRVGGFVLSHAGMMLVVMTLVKMTGNAGPVVFVLGNLFVMGLEGLIVGIQTLRLEYYEMFSRYFVGNGKKFTMISSENA